MGGESKSKARFMMEAQSSASICSASAVEPTTSAKSAVTTFRSLLTSAAWIFLTRAEGTAVFIRTSRISSVEVVTWTGWPQLVQNRSPGDMGAPQLEQARSEFPQLRQNFAPSGLSV